MRILAIDPGKCSGVAVFLDGRLKDVWAVRDHSLIPVAPGLVDVLVCEKPHIRKGTPRENDILTLAISHGRWLEAYRNAKHVCPLPVTWKGTLDKEVHHPRVIKRLTAVENLRLESGLSDLALSLRHNVLDAVGLGLWHLGRM